MESIKEPSEREMLAIIDQLEKDGKNKEAKSLAIITARRARITLALCKKAVARWCDKTSALACYASAIELLSPEDPVEKDILKGIQLL